MNKRTLVFFVLVATATIFAISSCNHSKTIIPVRKSITEAVYASGYIVPKNEYKVYALSDGYIVAKLKQAGDSVRKGEVLYQVQNDASSTKFSAMQAGYDVARTNADENSAALSDLRNKIQSAEARYRNDSLNYIRYKNMFDANAASGAQLDQASMTSQVSFNELKSAREIYQKTKEQFNADLKNAKSLLSASDVDLSNFQIRSMMDGMIYDMNKELGEAVRKNDQVADIGEKGHKYLELYVDQQDIEKVKLGLEVAFKMDVTGGQVYKARVTKIYPIMNQNDQTFKVEAEFEENYDFNFAHASVEANIIVGHKDNALLIPRAAIQADDMVEIKALGADKKVKIKKGLETLEFVEVVDGLNDKDELVIPGK